MLGFFKNLLTEVDDETFDVNRIAFIIGVVTFVAITGWAVGINKQTFDWIGYGTGFAAILAAGGGAVAFNRKYEQEEHIAYQASLDATSDGPPPKITIPKE